MACLPESLSWQTYVNFCRIKDAHVASRHRLVFVDEIADEGNVNQEEPVVARHEQRKCD